MNTLTLTFILASVSLSVIAQLLLKHGMSNQAVQSALSSGDLIGTGLQVFSNISVLGGLAAYASSAVVWLLVLSKVDVSKAYPFVGLGFVATMLFAYWFLSEPLTLHKIIGTLLVAAGVLLISS